jgi:hypothetical protein
LRRIVDILSLILLNWICLLRVLYNPIILLRLVCVGLDLLSLIKLFRKSNILLIEPMTLVFPAPAPNRREPSMLDVAVQRSRHIPVIVCPDVFNKFIPSLRKSNVVVVAYEPSQIRIFSPSFIIRDLVEKNQQIAHHLVLVHPQSNDLVTLKLVVEPHLHLSLLVDPDLVLIDTEEPNNRS